MQHETIGGSRFCLAILAICMAGIFFGFSRAEAADISGRIFTDEGSTGLDCSTSRIVAIRVNGSGTDTAECSNSPSNGSFSFVDITTSADDIITVYIDGETEKAVAVTETDGNNMTGFDLYTDHVIVRHDNSGDLTIDDMDNFDQGDDSDIAFTATSGTPDTLTVDSGHELYIPDDHFFTPGGDVSLDDLEYIGRYTAAGTESITVSGDWDDQGYFIPANSTVTMTGTFNTLSPYSPSGTNFYNLVIDPASAGTINVDRAFVTVTGALTVADGDTLSLAFGRTLIHQGSAELVLSGATGGAITGSGTLRFDYTSGGPGTDGTISCTVRFAATEGNLPASTFDARTYHGRVEAYSFSVSDRTITMASGTYDFLSDFYLVAQNQGDMTLHGGTNNPTINVAGDLNHHGYGEGEETLNSGSGTWTVSGDVDFAGRDVAGNSTVGHFNASDGNLFRMNGTSTTITSDGAGSFEDLEIFGGTVSSVDDLEVAGDFAISAGAFTQGGDHLSVGGSWSNDGTFNHGSNTVLFDSDDTGETIDSGGTGVTKDFYDVQFNNSAGGWTIQNNNLTATNDFTITDVAVSGFTVDSVTTEVRGVYSCADAEFSNTTWTSATLYLNGTSQTIGSKSQNEESYSNLQVGADTDIRMWESSATASTVDAAGSLYSQDHANTAGELFVWGDYHTQANDYWSYANDFDGSSGANRQVDVRLDPAAKVSVDSGDTLAVIGTSGNRITVSRQGSSNGYEMSVLSGGSINFQYADFDYLDGALGLDIQAGSTVTSLDNTSFDNLIGTAGTADAFITVASSVIGSSSKTVTGISFDNTGVGAEFNVNRTGSDDTGYWSFASSEGGFSGESNDGDDGSNEASPGMIRWDTTGEYRSDVDDNGASNTTDAQLTLRFSLGVEMGATSWVSSSTTGDADCSGVANTTDAMLILRNSLGLDMSGTDWCGD